MRRTNKMKALQAVAGLSVAAAVAASSGLACGPKSLDGKSPSPTPASDAGAKAALIAGKAPKLGAPIRLDLGGLGIRDMMPWHDEIHYRR
jgi:hypothetical protein